jgi:hypothetical protein
VVISSITDSHQPIFLRICHSPWMSIGQKVLVALRGITFAYLVMSFFMIFDYEIDRNEHGWLTVFEFSNIAYFLQLLYQGIAFVSLPCIFFICSIALSY